MHLYRTRFKKDILVEFLPSVRKSRSIVIICPGAPGVPSSARSLEFLSEKGFWVFRLRYRGTWESGGKFLRLSPTQDLLDVLDATSLGFQSIWEKKKFFVNPQRVIVFGNSFGGPAALLASSDSRIHKVIALSPVVDWRVTNKNESLTALDRIQTEAFGNCYRFALRKNWKTLARDNFYNPSRNLKNIAGEKVLLIHAQDDDIVPFASLPQFSKNIGASTYFLKRGGHFAGSDIMIPRIWKRIQKFLHE